MHDAGTWLTGRRRTVRAAAHLLSGITTATIAWGFLFGMAHRACKCEEPEPPTRLLTHGGAVALVALAVIAALTWASWRSRLGASVAMTGVSMMAWFVVEVGWVMAGTQTPDAAAYQAQLATWLLGALLFGRLVLDLVLDWLQRRADARPTRDPLPVGTIRRR